MAKEYRERPSSFVEITDPYEAYCFDEAVYYIRVELESGENGERRDPVFPSDTIANNDNNQSVIDFFTQQKTTTVVRKSPQQQGGDS